MLSCWMVSWFEALARRAGPDIPGGCRWRGQFNRRTVCFMCSTVRVVHAAYRYVQCRGPGQRYDLGQGLHGVAN